MGGVQFLGKVFVGMEGTDTSFEVLPRVTGPNNSFIDHIQNVSKASVVLKGVGSGNVETIMTPEGPRGDGVLCG